MAELRRLDGGLVYAQTRVVLMMLCSLRRYEG